MRVCGPAHNNLGIVYYRQKKYYLAAWEFQYAAKLMAYSPSRAMIWAWFSRTWADWARPRRGTIRP
jgi:hypothetical protein